MGRREDFMRHHGIFTCPTWCAQDKDEDQVEAHFPAEGRTVATSNGGTVTVRPFLDWWDGNHQFEIIISPDPEENGVLVTSDDLDALQAAIDAADSDMDDSDEKWAYPGAEDDYDESEEN